MKLTDKDLVELYRRKTGANSLPEDQCPSEELLIRAASGQLSQAERVRLADHLGRCSRCADAYSAAWTLKPWVDDVTAGETVGGPRTSRHERAFLYVAASLLLATAITTALLVRENRRLVVRQSDYAARKESEKSQLTSEIAALRRSLQESSEPHVNVSIIDLMPGDTLRGMEGSSEAILLPDSPAPVVFVLAASSEVSHPSYELKILRGTEQVWTGQGLKRSAFGNFTVAVPRKLLTAGAYVFRLYGRNGQKRVLLQEYRLQVKG